MSAKLPTLAVCLFILFSISSIFTIADSIFQEKSHTVDTGIILNAPVETSATAYKASSESVKVVEDTTRSKPLNDVLEAIDHLPAEANSTEHSRFQATLTVLKAILAELKQINSKMPASNYTSLSTNDKLIFPLNNSNHRECPARFQDYLLTGLNFRRSEEKDGGYPPLSYDLSLAREAYVLAVKQAEMAEDFASTDPLVYLPILRHYGQYAEDLHLKSDHEIDVKKLDFWSGRWPGRPWVLHGKNGTEYRQMTKGEWRNTTSVGFGCEVIQTLPDRYSLWVGVLFKYV